MARRRGQVVPLAPVDALAYNGVNATETGSVKFGDDRGNQDMPGSDKKTVAVVCIELLIAAVLVAAANLNDPDLSRLYHSYFADFALPFGFYFLLVMPNVPPRIRRHWWGKAAAVFALCATSETLPYVGIFALARVFDPVNYLMYGGGVLLAALVDRLVLARLISFWDADAASAPAPVNETA